MDNNTGSSYDFSDLPGKPQILSLSVVNGTCGKQSSASRWLKCEAEGKPVPKIVWLSPSRRLLENQGLSFESVLWRTTACIPYLEEEVNQVITCRAENSDFAERSFPESKDLRMVVIVVNVVVLMSLSSVFAIVIICRSEFSFSRISVKPVYPGADVPHHPGSFPSSKHDRN